MAENNTDNITKGTWPKLFFKVWEEAITKVNMVSGFISTGMWPCNSFAIPNEAYLPGVAYSPSDTTVNTVETAPEDHPPSVIPDANLQNGNQMIVTAEVHSAPITLDLPIMVNEGTEIVSLPVCFQHENEAQEAIDMTDVSAVALQEVGETDFGLPSEY